MIADLHGVNDSNIVMAGAHLDSVPAGPGINDNGSGSAALLEVGAAAGPGHVPQNTIRFAWWGAEELWPLRFDRIGSTEVDGRRGLDDVAMYLNFDMIGSPNYISWCTTPTSRRSPRRLTFPPGSEDIEDDVRVVLHDGQACRTTTPSSRGRSDYQAFIENGIPSSGLFTGAEEPKTDAQAAIWGWHRRCRSQLDPCSAKRATPITNNDDHCARRQRRRRRVHGVGSTRTRRSRSTAFQVYRYPAGSRSRRRRDQRDVRLDLSDQ